MSPDQDWDVTASGRIEHVTDRENFPELFLAALRREAKISLIKFNRPRWPYTTTVVIRVTASTKKRAEEQARELLLPVLLEAAKETGVEGPFGWTLRAGAELAGDVIS